MTYISSKDIYEIRIASLVNNVDKDVLIELYQPIMGSQATILYLTLLKQKRNEDNESFIFSHEDLCSVMQVAPGTLLSARQVLEAVGLIRTYEKKNNNGSYYIYVMYAPKNPKDFFNDVLFKGLLIQAVGEKEAKRLARHYVVDLEIGEEFEEVSASFIDVFNPDYDDSSFTRNIGGNIVGHDVGRVNTEFSFENFFEYLTKNSQIRKSAISKSESKKIERIATLYGLNEETMASIIIDVYEPDETTHINFDKVDEKAKDQVRYPFLQKTTKKSSKTSKVSGDGALVQKIKLMENTAPAQYLALTQHNTAPVSSELSILKQLSEEYGLSNGVINVVIDYVLAKNNGNLSREYSKKIAVTLVRNNIETVVDAMNYLKKAAKPAVPSTKVEKNAEKQAPVEEKKEEKVEDNELDELLGFIDDLKKNGGNK